MPSLVKSIVKYVSTYVGMCLHYYLIFSVTTMNIVPSNVPSSSGETSAESMNLTSKNCNLNVY